MKVVPATPGPWQVEDHAPLRDGQHYLEVATPHTLPDGGYPMLICTVQPTATDGSRGPDPEQRANATLIAAAPLLLGLLRDLRRELAAGHLNVHKKEAFDERCPLCLTEAAVDDVLRELSSSSQGDEA